MTGAAPYEKTFIYDEVSNWTTENGVVSTYDTRDRLMSVGGAAYTWSDNGNLSSKAGDSYAWDFEDRLIRDP